MQSNSRMQGLHSDLLHAASDLDTLSRALDGHARYLRHSIHREDAAGLGQHAQDLHASACDMRDIAQGIQG